MRGIFAVSVILAAALTASAQDQKRLDMDTETELVIAKVKRSPRLCVDGTCLDIDRETERVVVDVKSKAKEKDAAPVRARRLSDDGLTLYETDGSVWRRTSQNGSFTKASPAKTSSRDDCPTGTCPLRRDAGFPLSGIRLSLTP